MDIKRLLTRGGQVFAAEIVDGTEEYKVFIDAIGNTVILPALIADGWKLASLPLNLQKNGIALEDFPKMEYSPTPQEELEMYDLMGTPMPMEERRAYISRDVAKTIDIAQGDYTITTREEFLAYLKGASSAKLPTDFLPINYFVHPAARFTLEEFNNPENREYVCILEQRRHLTLQQFDNLRAWAISNGLRKDFTALELVSFYFQWGICGLNLNLLSRKTVECFSRRDMGLTCTSMDVSLNGATMRATYTYDFGLLDRFQNEYRKPGTENYQLMDSKAAVHISQTLSDDEAAVVRIRLPKGELVEEWSTLETNISFNERFLNIGETTYTSLCPAGNFGSIHPKFWNPSAAAEMNEDMYLRAIAEEFIERRRVKASVSSYKALCESGCSPLAALIYMRDRLNLLSVGPLDTDEDAVVIETQDIKDFLFGEEIPLEKQTMLEDMMNGVINIDRVAKGLESDANQTTDRLYSQLYCIHHVMGVPVKDIYLAIRDFDGKTPVKFSNGTISITLNSKPIDAALTGYNEDKQNYRLAQVKNATNYLWVSSVARELGPEDATRHVAICGYTATQSARTEAIIAQLEEVYRNKTQANVVDPGLRDAYDKYSRCFAIDAWFSGAMRGYYTFPKEISEDIVKVDEETRKLWKAPITGPKVESTTLIADNAVYYEMCSWHWYCVNAVVQPYIVKPRRCYSLKETSLSAVWYDTQMLDIYPELLKRGLVQAGAPSWEGLAMVSPIFARIDPTDMSVPEYYAKSQEFIDGYDRRFRLTAPPHPLEATYPRLAPNEDEVVHTPATPSDDYKFKVGYGKILSYQPDNVEDSVTTNSPIQYFQHLSAEDFFFTGGNVRYPTNAGKALVTVSNGEVLYVDDHILPAADIGSLDPDKYPVTHMYGRKYLVCDVLGTLWTVEV